MITTTLEQHARISDGQLFQVRQTSPIADVVREFGIALTEVGATTLQGRCPFHDDGDGPALYVSPAGGYWTCGASEGGDVVAFVRHARGLDYQQAVEHLAERAGITLQPEPVPSSAVG
ncbi:CHC2 zinc finger domain-containing protein [Microbispora rosea]|uniref:CHC2 zinc finger domain-containing protein n=1 Tax=Microbispora rosea TaxID=58117 RepID=UPI00379C2772